MMKPIRDREIQGQLAYQAGLAAEKSVAAEYMRRGLTLAQERWRGSHGEIDLILRDGDAIVFVEVKKSRNFAAAAAQLSGRQVQRLWQSAEEFLGSQPKGNLTEIRFDVALVDGAGQYEIIENAFA